MNPIKTILAIIIIGVSIASCEDILEVPDISERQVEILAPTDSVTVTNNEVNFTWNGVVDANAYLIQIASPSFINTSQIVLDSTIVVDSTFIGTKASKLLESGNYEWRVKALNSDYQTPFSSSAFEVSASDN